MKKVHQTKEKGEESQQKRRKFPPATTVEGRENQLISLAVDLAEQQLRDGTASAQVITHYLKLGSTKERLEKEILEAQKGLMQAKKEALESSKRVEELYANALAAFTTYNQHSEVDDEDVP